MSRWKAIVSLVCLAVWLPATQHCRLERLPGFAFLHCPTDRPGDSDCEGDACDTVEKGSYKGSENVDLIVLPLAAVTAIEAPALIPPQTHSVSAVVVLHAGPPREPPERWHLYSPIALPIRGPSPLS